MLSIILEGQPKPPAPTTKILELNIFCPETPIFFNINCLEYFLRSSAFNCIINLDFLISKKNSIIFWQLLML